MATKAVVTKHCLTNSILEPDQPAPTAPATVGRLMPEHGLALSVIEAALKDLEEGAAHARRRRSALLRKHRDRFQGMPHFFRDRSERWGTLAWWCSFLHISPSAITARVEHWLADLEAGLDDARIRPR